MHLTLPKLSQEQFRLGASFYMLCVLGFNDASLGGLITVMEPYYNVNHAIISLVFVFTTVGYVLSAVTIGMLIIKLSLRYTLLLGAGCFATAFALLCWAPPFELLCASYVVLGFGAGIQDAGTNIYVAGLKRSSEKLNLLHGFYGIGAFVAPLVAAAILASGIRWNFYYLVTLGLALINIPLAYFAFQTQQGNLAEQQDDQQQNNDDGGKMLKQVVLKRATWLTAMFLLLYVGAEVSIGGWIVTFLVTVKKGDPDKMRIVASSFWAGIALGRFVLGIPTVRFGERRMVALYLILAAALKLIVWLVPEIIADSVCIALVGVVLGPMFPTAISVVTKLTTKDLHATTVGLVSSLGFAGAAIFPFLSGVIASQQGIWVLEPFALSLFVAMLGLWVALPRQKTPSSVI
ncbi:MFS efflux transporter [Basidiobolus meristosporus CBS 931.73]|uniref:MFS efflux transporter n=1 Tax=Basidiobolus meristosporus CBS 931.73 TaxID=1314790 RepID=A0A1Y1XRT9_9FUNG|nr:MFS efflux transporter [Basidiobolus meristosporus CBS 931.73]|eukprot:ORX88468.1 MFS efflux transporter [Basidiobolus meristosporus CBS 931.73]